MKKILISLLVIVSIVCVAVDIWYVYVMLYAPDKIISQTFKVGDQVIFKEDGSTEKRHFIDINMYDDVFEIQFNYMLDENQDAFYSQGLQYVLAEGSETFNFDGVYTRNVKSIEGNTTKFKGTDHIGSTYYLNTFNMYDNKQFSNITKINYMSGDNYESTYISTNPIDHETMFKIQLGDNLYGMKLKYTDYEMCDKDKNLINNHEMYIGSTETHAYNKVYLLFTNIYWNINHDFKAYDIDYFAELLYSACCESVENGTNMTSIFEFGDMFNYYKYDADKKQYSNETVSDDEHSKIVSDIKSYYCIGVQKHEGKMKSSSQSLFNCYKGNSNYNTDKVFNDYFIGRTLVSVNVDKFKFIESEVAGAYYLSLDEDFKAYYLPYKHLVELDIEIDLDYIASLGITLLGVKEDSLSGFKIFNSRTISNRNGEIIEGVVNYV